MGPGPAAATPSGAAAAVAANDKSKPGDKAAAPPKRDMLNVLDRQLRHVRKPVSLLNKSSLAALSSVMRPRITVKDVITHLEGHPRFARAMPLYGAMALNLDPSYNAKMSDQQLQQADAKQ